MKVSYKNIVDFFLRLLILSYFFEFISGTDFLISKITTSLYILCSIFIFKYELINVLFSYKKFFFPLILYLLLLTYSSFKNISPYSSDYINLILIQNILLFLCYTAHENKYNNTIKSSFNFFNLGCVILLVFFLIGIGIDYSWDNRITVMGFNQNLISNYFSFFIFFLIAQQYQKGEKLNTLNVMLIILSLYFLFESASRQALLLLFSFILVLFYEKNKKYNLYSFIFISAIFLLFVFLTIIFLFSDTVLFERFFTTVSDGDSSGRFDIWVNYLSFLFSNENIIIGIGDTGLKTVVEQYISGKYTSSHNLYVETLMKSGIVGLLIILFFYFNIIFKTLKNYQKSNDIYFLAYFFPLILISLVAHPFGTRFLWLIFAHIIVFKPYSNRLFVYEKK